MPNQSHNLIIVPKFPGSLISSSATIFELKSISLFAGILKMPKTLFGDFKLLICLSWVELIEI